MPPFKKHLNILFVLVVALLLIPTGVSALALYSGDQVTIDQPVFDDVFAAGGVVDVNASVSSLVAAGGIVNINAPVSGDVIVTGGVLDVNSAVGGKVVAFGGVVTINASVGTNVIVSGGAVILGEGATVAQDAMLSGGAVIHAGQVGGNLTVEADSFDNTGTAGNLYVELEEPSQGSSTIFWAVFDILLFIGMFALGILFLAIAPKRFLMVEENVRRSALFTTIVGLVAIIFSPLVLILFSITVILLPMGLVGGMLLVIALLFSTLFVSASMGHIIARYLKWDAKEWQMFAVGFVIMNLLYMIPVVGFIILVITTSLGFGAVMVTVYRNLDALRGESKNNE
ncbi:MAG: hypothetical protein WC346_07640 [Methanogenium sp.]|jgi:hypothetical protein